MIGLVFFQLARKHVKPIKRSLELRQAKQKVSVHNREDNAAVTDRSRLQSQQGPTTKQEAVPDATVHATFHQLSRSFKRVCFISHQKSYWVGRWLSRSKCSPGRLADLSSIPRTQVKWMWKCAPMIPALSWRAERGRLENCLEAQRRASYIGVSKDRNNSSDTVMPQTRWQNGFPKAV